MKRFLFISLMFVAGQGLSAQMTLNDCLIYARDHAHKNVISRLEIDKASADVRLTASNLMPYLSMYANGNMSFGRNIDPETNTYDNKQTLSTGFGLQMSVPLFDGLVNINNLKSARTAKLRAKESARIEEDAVSMEVIKAFYQVTYCKAMVLQMEEQLKRDTQDLKATQKGVELGAKSGADVAELEALVANDEFELINQRNLLAKSYLTLRSLMGMELSEEPLDLKETEIEESQGEMMKHPKVAEAELAVKASKYDLRAAKGSYSPSISLTGGVSTSYYKMINTEAVYPSFSRQWHDNMGEYIGLSFSFPIFNGLASTNRVKKASILLKENEVRLEQVKYDLDKETREAELDYISSTDELKAAYRRLEAEQIAFNATRRKYELGQASAIDLYTSSSKLATAKAGAEGKRIQKIINLITLRYCRGEKLIKEVI